MVGLARTGRRASSVAGLLSTIACRQGSTASTMALADAGARAEHTERADHAERAKHAERAERASLDRPANVFGALALVVADQIADTTATAAGSSESAPAALAAVLHFLDRPSVHLLQQGLRLTA